MKRSIFDRTFAIFAWTFGIFVRTFVIFDWTFAIFDRTFGIFDRAFAIFHRTFAIFESKFASFARQFASFAWKFMSFARQFASFQPKLASRSRYGLGSAATIRSGPPEPPRIFIGRANTHAPRAGRRSRWATFSKPGTSAPLAMRWTMKSFDWP